MNTLRHLSSGSLPPRGPGECRWCGAKVAGRRRTWCSDACVKQYLIRASSSTARAEVFKRDRGVCALCGLDTERIRQRFEAEHRRIGAYLARLGFRPPTWPASYSDWSYAALIDGQRWPARVVRHIWQADHIVPVAEGGGACGLDNLRTLCWRCHGRETGALRRRLNAARAQEGR